MPRRPEIPGNQEIIDKIESLKPAVGKAAQSAGENLWQIPNMRICPQIEYREAKDWLPMPPPQNELADCFAGYYKKEHKVGVNLTAVRESLRSKKRTANLRDPVTVLAMCILVHENFVHANCQSNPIEGEEKEKELLEWAQAHCTEIGEDGKSFLPLLQRQGIKIKNRGGLLEYIFDQNMGPLVIGRYFDEALAYIIGFRAFASVYSSITGESEKEGGLVYLNLIPVPDQLKDEDITAAFDFYNNDEPTVARSYFSGDFFAKYVLSLPVKERTEALLRFFICDFDSFYQAITPPIKS